MQGLPIVKFQLGNPCLILDVISLRMDDIAFACGRIFAPDATGNGLELCCFQITKAFGWFFHRLILSLSKFERKLLFAKKATIAIINKSID